MGQIINPYMRTPPIWSPNDTGLAWAWFEASSYALGAGIVLSDDFNDNSIDATKWTTPTGTGVSETGSQLQIVSTATSHLRSLTTANYMGQSVQVKAVTVDTSSVNIDTQLLLATSDVLSTFWMMDVNATTLRCFNNSSLVFSVTYNSTTHRWWRIEFSGTNTLFRTSSDGITWTTIFTVTTTGAITALYTYLRLYNATGSSKTAAFDDLTTTASGNPGSVDGAIITSNWADQSGNNRNAVLSGSTMTYETNELNGKSVIRKPTTSAGGFTLPSLAALTSASIYIVWKVTTGSTSSNSFQAGGTNHYPYSDGTIYDGFCSSVRKEPLTSQITINGTWHVVRIWSKSADWGMMQNALTVLTTGSNTVQMHTAPFLFGNGTTYMIVDCAAIYIFTDKLGSTDDTSMRARINTLFGL